MPFRVRGHPRLISLIHPQNERSIAVALRLGMRRERTPKSWVIRARVYGIDRPATMRFEPNAALAGCGSTVVRTVVFEKDNDFTEFGLPVQIRYLLYYGTVGNRMSACGRFRSVSVRSLAFPPIGPPGRLIRYDPESDQMGRGTLVSGD